MLQRIVLSILMISSADGCAYTTELQDTIFKAKEAQEQNLFDEAAAKYLNAVDLLANDDPAKVELLMSAGDCRLDENGIEARKIYSKILDLPQATKVQKTEAMLKIAWSYFEDSEKSKAIEEAQKILMQDGLTLRQNAEANLILGQDLYMQGKYDAAVIPLAKVVLCETLSSPKRVEACQKLVQSAYNGKNNLSEEKVYEKVLSLIGNAHSDIAWYGIASVYTPRKNFSSSSQICKRLISEPTASPFIKQSALMLQTQNLIGLGLYDEAAQDAEKTLKNSLLPQEIFKIRLLRSSALMKAGKYNEAVTETQKLVGSGHPYQQGVALVFIGECYIAQKKYASAIEAYRSIKNLPNARGVKKLKEIANTSIQQIEKIQSNK